MDLMPFILLGLLNGLVVGCAAGLVARAINDGDDALRFRDTSALGMIGAVGGCIIATAINSVDGYVTGGPSSLLFQVMGAVVVLIWAAALRRRNAGQQQALWRS
jgi:uncharacterized membrane protein YeaQ/YmgE (transglycosylase-associated protein family)